MQLDCTLRSFFLHCSDASTAKLFVIYKATSDLHDRQYSQLAKEYDDVCFVRQRNFRRDVLGLLLQFAGDEPLGSFRKMLLAFPWLSTIKNIRVVDPTRTVLFMVDDNIFVHEFSLLRAHKSLIQQQDAVGFSLRLGRNTTYCYMLDKPQRVPTFASLDGQVMKFNWVSDGDGDFAYPLEVSSSVYRIGELVPLLSSIPFSNPNLLEGNMATRAQTLRTRWPFLLCFRQSVTFCNPINMVQRVSPSNRARKGSVYSIERLARLFEEGHRISVDSYKGFVASSCHQERDLVFSRKSDSEEN